MNNKKIHRAFIYYNIQKIQFFNDIVNKSKLKITWFFDKIFKLSF